MVNGIPPVYLGKIWTRSAIPYAWTSSVLFQSFYDTLVQKYGSSAFEVPRLWKQIAVFRGFYDRTYRAKAIRTADTLQGAVADGLDRDVARALKDIEERRRTWRRLRPWYDSEYFRWEVSPYSHISARDILRRFIDASRPEERESDPLYSEIKASSAATILGYFMNHYICSALDARYPRGLWFWKVVACMMEAALPSRMPTNGVYPTRWDINVWGPSMHATQAGTDKWRFPLAREVPEVLTYYWTLAGRHKTRVPEYSNGQIVALKSNRVWLLEQAIKCKREHEQLFPLPEPLSQALNMGLQALFAQAVAGSDDNNWLKFDFDFPPYSTTFVTRDGAGNITPFSGFGSSGVTGDDLEISPLVTAAAARVVTGRRRGSGLRLAQPQRRYFTVSEVGEMVSDDRMGTNWALVADGQGGYNVVDVSGESISVSLPSFLILVTVLTVAARH